MSFGLIVKTSTTDAGVNSAEVTKSIGGLQSVLAPFTTMFDASTAVTGNAKFLQLGYAAIIGNGIAHWAHTGNIGVAVTKGLQYSVGGEPDY